MRNLLAYFCLFFSLTVGAQAYHIQHVGIEKGLSNSFVADIAQDRRGFIWIATESGLNRFDGSHFTVYRSGNSALLNDILNTVYYDRSNDFLWIGSNGDGVYALDCSTDSFHIYNKEETRDLAHVLHFGQARDGGIWMVPHHGRVVYYDSSRHTFAPLSGGETDSLPQNNRCALDDGAGHLYIGHALDGMSIVDLKTKRVKRFRHREDDPNSLPGNNVLCLYRDSSHRLWVGTERGLGWFDEQRETFVRFQHEAEREHSLVADHIYDIQEMEDGTLWITSDVGGISILRLADLTLRPASEIRFHNLTADGKEGQYLASRNIRSLLQDSYGNIWIGNYGKGLDFIGHSQPLFGILPYRAIGEGRRDERPVYSLYCDRSNRLWLGGENELVLFEGGNLQKRIDLQPYLSRPNGQVISIIEAEEDVLLLGIFDDGLIHYNIKTGRMKRVPMKHRYVDVNSLWKDEEGQIWIGTEFGIYVYRDGGTEFKEEMTAFLRDQAVASIVSDSLGQLWVGTYGGGIVLFDRSGQMVYHLTVLQNTFPNDAINQLYVDASGGIWAATRYGLVYVADPSKPEAYEVYGLQEGLADLFVRSVSRDAEGLVWVSTNAGLSCWNPAMQRFDNYDYRDGLPTDNFVERSSCMDASGRLYFGSLRGVCAFMPQAFTEKRTVSPVRIVECHPLGARGSYTIYFSVPDYAQNGQVEYAYSIDGLTSSWTSVEDENSVTFHNLSPGTYHFRIKARLRNQEWDEPHAASLRLYVAPPWWLTWYAKLAYGVLLMLGIGAGFLLYRRRLMWKTSIELERKNIRAEQELNTERLRFYTNITHELRTPLTLIIGPLDDLTRDAHMPSNYGRKIRLIRDSAQRLLDLVNQILDFRKTETQNRKLVVQRGELGSIVAETGLRYKELNRNPRVKFDIHIENGSEQLYFDPEIVSTILNNLLSNACKYTPEGTITLTLQWTGTGKERMAEIAVADTGYGIEPEALPHIFDRYYQAEGKHQASGTGIGLALVKGLADLHQAQLGVESEPGKGTKFTFRLQTANTYPNALHKECEAVQLVPPVEKEENLTTGQETEAKERPLMLIVEDNDDIRDYITDSFKDEYRLLTATNGQEGVGQALETVPDIIISDVMMPVMDGMELCRTLKTDIRTSHIPLILLTAKDAEQDKEEGYGSGADSYLTKPFSARLLRIRVNNLLESRHRLAQLLVARAQALQPTPEKEPEQLNRLDKTFLDRLTTLIETGIQSGQLDMVQLSEQMHMSHSTLYRKIKGLTGMTGNEFIRKLRLKNSLRLLTDTDSNVSESAYASGFNDLGYFRTCFKEEYGMSPSEYLKRKKEN